MAVGTLAAFWAVSFLLVLVPGPDWAYLIAAGLRDRSVLPAVAGLLAARDQPTSVTELAGLMGMTKQAASKLVGAMVSGGYVRRGTDSHDGRQRPVTLTNRGEALLSAVEQVYAELEDDWAKLIGASHLDRMRRDLVHILSDPGNGQLPPVRPTW